MNRAYELSHVTQDYLETFYAILDRMICGMTQVRLTDSISYNFIVQIIPHHQAAVEMSRNILRYTTNIPLQEIALQIISEQTKGIETMRGIAGCCIRLCNTEQEVGVYQKKTDQIMQTMFSCMQNACSSNDINGNFMREMIPHHRGAIEMAENALKHRICPELKPVLEGIIATQRRGIREMQQLLHCMGQ